MFIIKFTTCEEKAAARIKLYNDEVFSFSFEEIMAINSPLSVEEIFCSADRMTDYLLEHNINETSTLRLEIEDLKKEAGDETTAYLIMTVIFHKLRALRKRYAYAVKTWHALQPLCEEWDQFKPLNHRIYNREVERKYYEKRGVDCETYELLTINKNNPLGAKEAIQKMLTKAADYPVKYLMWLENIIYMFNYEYNGLFSEELEIAQTMIKKKSANNFSDKKIVVQNNENVTNVYHVAAPTGQAATADVAKSDELHFDLLPDKLRSPRAKELWRELFKEGYVNRDCLTNRSRVESAIMAHEIAKKLSLKRYWNMFVTLWQKPNLRQAYYRSYDGADAVEFEKKIEHILI